MLASLRFALKTGHFPATYRTLFKSISNCYLTPAFPGKAVIEGNTIRCTTSSRRLLVHLVSDDMYWIDRQQLSVMTPRNPEEVPLSHPSLIKLRTVLNHMLENGVPFQVSDTDVTHLGI